MRRDYLIGILVGLSAIPCGVALMVAPILFFEHPSRAVLNVFFYGGLALTGILLASAIAIALQDEEAKRRKGQRRRMIPLIGMVLFGIAFMSCAAWYFWPAKNALHQKQGALAQRNFEAYDARVFVPESITPQVLSDFYRYPRTEMEGNAGVQPYLGKWAIVKGTFRSRTEQIIAEKETTWPAILITLDLVGDSQPTVRGIFDARQWADTVSLLARGDVINIVGRIQTVYLWNVVLTDCELVFSTRV